MLGHGRVVAEGSPTNWVWPIVLMTLFLGLMGGALGDALGGSYIDFVAMTVFLGLEGTMTAVCQDSSRGITDRFRSLPMSGIAVVGGRCIADLLDSIVSLTIVTVAGLAFGWRPDTTVAEALAVGGLLLLLRIAMLWAGIFVGLKAATPESLGPVNMLVLPILFFSSVFIDTATMPRWLGTIADANPLSATGTTVFRARKTSRGSSWTSVQVARAPVTVTSDQGKGAVTPFARENR